MKKICILLSLVIMTVSVPVGHAAPAEDRLPAFPGAEGGGMYTTGARSANNPEIYHVTTLEDYGKDEPAISGSFRDAVSEDNRIIVFDVAGNIELKSRLNIGGNNLTILGQTAPGDGICLTGYDTHIESQTSNIILRYLRFRMGDSNDVEDDSLGGRNCSNIIVDHCSVSWSVDECASFYENTDFTMQWCIISESLNNSVHGKGAHGYGGIWGGRNASFHHNLMAHHSSRNPRAPQGNLEGSADYDMSTQTTLSDWRNNVIYNWGGNSAYGGQGAMALNIINCYYKAGPATDDGKRSKIYELSSTGNGQTFKWSTDLYVDGTYVDGDPNVTENNALGITKDSSAQNYYVWTNGHSGTSSKDIIYSDINENTDAQKVHFKYQIDYPVTTQTAEEAYEDVLAKAGASVSRDSLDARVVEDVRLGRGECGKNKNGIIDTPSEAGGLPTLSGIAEPDSDKDGLPDRWEEQNGTNKNNPGDAVQIVSSGYTNIEEYANDVADGSYVRGNATPTATPAPTPTATPTVTPTGTPTAAPTATPGPTATITPVPTAAPTSTVAPVPTAEPTPVTTEAPPSAPAVTPAATVAPTPVTTEAPPSTPTVTPAATNIPTPEVTEAPKPVPTAESTAEPTPTSVTAKTPEPTKAAEPTATAEPQSSVTPSPEPTNEICWQPQGAGEFDPPPVIINNLLIVDLLPSRPFGDSSQSPWQFDDFGIRATENPKSATNKPDNGYAPISGSAAKINVMTDGVIETKQKASFGKTGYVFEFDKGTDTGGRAIYKHPGQGLIETVIFDAKEYCDYYIFVAGSKGIIGEIIFTPNESGNRPTPGPTGPPTPTATPVPTAEPTPITTETPQSTPTVTPAATTAPTPVTTKAPPPTPTVTPTETAAPTPVTTEAPKPTPTVTPMITATPTEIPTPTPTTTKKPDLTPPGPTAKPVPTAEPTSTPTATSAPTAEPTPVTTEAPQPTTAPTATVTPEATSIPTPTSKPVNTPSSEPNPTATSMPTAVPSPTATSTPEPTVKPENGYMYQIDNLTVSDNTVTVDITNISGSHAKLIIALYTETGILTDIQEEDIAIAVGDTDSIFFEYGILNADIIKAFVWNSFEGNRPMAEAKEITYNQKII